MLFFANWDLSRSYSVHENDAWNHVVPLTPSGGQPFSARAEKAGQKTRPRGTPLGIPSDAGGRWAVKSARNEVIRRLRRPRLAAPRYRVLPRSVPTLGRLVQGARRNARGPDITMVQVKRGSDPAGGAETAGKRPRRAQTALPRFRIGAGESLRGNPLKPVLSPFSCRNKKRGRRRHLT